MGPTEKKVYVKGMSPSENAEKIAKAMKENHEAGKRMPKVFEDGEGLEEVLGDDSVMGD